MMSLNIIRQHHFDDDFDDDKHNINVERAHHERGELLERLLQLECNVQWWKVEIQRDKLKEDKLVKWLLQDMEEPLK